MPHLETWNKLPPAIRQHLIDRMQDRSISIGDLNKLRIWVESRPLVPGSERVAPRWIGAVRPPLTTKSRGPTKPVRGAFFGATHGAPSWPPSPLAYRVWPISFGLDVTLPLG